MQNFCEMSYEFLFDEVAFEEEVCNFAFFSLHFHLICNDG